MFEPPPLPPAGAEQLASPLDALPSWIPTAVEVDADYQRIAAMPRYDWDQDPHLPWITYTLTNQLRLPGPPCVHCRGEWYSMDQLAPTCPGCGRPTLKPVQAAALWTWLHSGGLFASMRVGAGKTLCTLLGPTLLRAERPGLVIKAALRNDTFRAIREAAKWWRVHPAFASVALMRPSERRYQRTILSYEELQHKAGALKLLQGNWDVMVLDEFQEAKNRASARQKKLKRAHRHSRPNTGVFSGSISTRSFGDWWPFSKMALGPRSPLPLELRSFLSWCYALDEKIPDGQRLDPGPLVHLTPAHERPPEAAKWSDGQIAQWAFGRRFVSTPGVISTKDDVPPYGLEIEVVRIEAPAPVRYWIQQLRAKWETPDGNEFDHAFELWARERWMARGGWFCWDPQPPQQWRAAYKAQSAFIRSALRDYKHIVDQPSQVPDAVAAGRIDDGGLLKHWARIQPTFEPHSVWRWLPAGSYVMIEHAVAWLRERPRHAIVWVEHQPIGEAVARLAGVSFYAEGARDAQGQHVSKAARSCVCSIASCGTGKNLQGEFNQNYFLEMPTTGLQSEQTIGRTHRDRQFSDTVHVVIPLLTVGDLRGLQQAIWDAERIQRVEQIPQKLCYGTWYGFDLAQEHELL